MLFTITGVLIRFRLRTYTTIKTINNTLWITLSQVLRWMYWLSLRCIWIMLWTISQFRIPICIPINVTIFSICKKFQRIFSRRVSGISMLFMMLIKKKREIESTTKTFVTKVSRTI